MNHRSLFFTANAGFFITVNQITLAVDAFPRILDRGFSALSSEAFQQLCGLPEAVDTRYVITTHDHSDHYSAQWTKAFMAEHPAARFIGAVDKDPLPASPDSGSLSLSREPSILLQGEHPTYYLPGITLEFLRLPHEGAAFANVANYGCLITFPASRTVTGNQAENSGPCRILFLGDAKPADPAVAQWIAGRHIDLALLNFPWITLPKGKRFIDQYLPHTRIAALHLPYEADDRNGYLAAARQALSGYPGHDIVLLTHFAQRLDF